jgi:hypothetical protein
MEPDGLLPCLKEQAYGSYLEADESNLDPHILIQYYPF